MTRAAANSLLKTLEEPGAGCVLILLADSDANLPVTIRSRCQRILMPLPEQAQALEWLQQNAPLLAKERSAEVDLGAISNVKARFSEYLTHDFEPAALAAVTAAELGTRDALTLFLQWTTEHVKTAELSTSGGRTNSYRHPYERRFFSQALARLQYALRLDNPSLKTQTVLEGVLADIRIMRVTPLVTRCFYCSA